MATNKLDIYRAEDIADTNLRESDWNCGIVVAEYVEDLDVVEMSALPLLASGAETGRYKGGMVLATTTQKERAARDRLKKAGFTAIWVFKNPQTKNTVTLWAADAKVKVPGLAIVDEDPDDLGTEDEYDW